jgi:hypothetical protein
MNLFIKKMKIIIFIKSCQMNLLYLIFANSESREILLEDNVETSNKKLKEIGQLEAQTGQ